MSGDASEIEIKEQILRCLRDFYPVKADEVVVVSAVQRSSSGGSVEQISGYIRSLRDHGWIEELVLKAPSGGTQTSRFKITPSGIEHLRSVERRGIRDLSIALTEIKDQLVAICDEIKADMEGMRQDLERSTKDLVEIKELVDRYVGKLESEKVREEQIILRVLSGDEKAVYHVILEAGGVMLQKDLVARKKMSNAKVSRIVDRLESRGILTKERHGATNRLRIIINPPIT